MKSKMSALNTSKAFVLFLVGLVAGLMLSMIVSNYSLIAGRVSNSQRYASAWNQRSLLENDSTPRKGGSLRFKNQESLIQRKTTRPSSHTTVSTPRSTVISLSDYQRQQAIQYQREPMSHDEVQALDDNMKNKTTREYMDSHSHNDDDTIAHVLFDKIRVFCWVMTAKANHRTKADHVKATWGRRCNYLYFMSDGDDEALPALNLHTQTGRSHLTAKTMKSFDFAYKEYLDKADWFMKVDDDTYVIMENLRYMLTSHVTTEPVFFGHHFKTIVPQGYFSGGGGYVLSREALRRFGMRDRSLCKQDHGDEDVEIGWCMQKLGVNTGDGRDNLDRSRFHCFNPATHLQGGYPDWYYHYDKYGAQKGMNHISDYPITFHYMSVDDMYNMEFYTYHLQAYGIVNRPQDLNRKQVKLPPPASTSSRAPSSTQTTTTTQRTENEQSNEQSNEVIDQEDDMSTLSLKDLEEV